MLSSNSRIKWTIKLLSLFLFIIAGFTCFGPVIWRKNLAIHPEVCGVTADQKHLFENGYSLLTNTEFLTFLKDHWIVLPSKKPRSLKNKTRREFSQYGQSLKVAQLLDHKKGGFFIECGAADGETFSNSLYLEIAYNWTGLLIEPNPLMFEKLLAKQRNAYLLNACLAIENSTEKSDFQLEGLFGGLADAEKNNANKLKVTQVQCFPLLSVLLSLGNPTVDYLSLDVEGAELAILKTVPWDKVDIKLISIEYRVIFPRSKTINTGESIGKLKQLRGFFKTIGLYKELAILPQTSNTEETDKSGLDVFFQKIEV